MWPSGMCRVRPEAEVSALSPAALIEAADLIERRLVKTASGFTIPAKDLTDYQRGIVYAIRQVQALLRQEAAR